MFRVFIILLILVPLLEIWGLAQMGQWIGALPTVLAVIVTSVIGVVLARRQGLEVYRLTVLQLNRGELPSDTLLDGLLDPGGRTAADGSGLLYGYRRFSPDDSLYTGNCEIVCETLV